MKGRTGNLKPIYGIDSPVKIEDILMAHMTNMVVSLNIKDKTSFDESMEFTEFLLEDERASFNELKNHKEKLEVELYKKVTDIVLRAREMGNSIKKKRYKEKNISILEWEFRRSYLKKLVQIYTKRRILKHRVQTYAKLEGVKINGNKTSAGSKRDSKPAS